MIAWITARGGSRRLPGKNIKCLAGKPLIAYTIEAARDSKSIDRILLSTDDPEIASVAKHYGAEVPFLRPQNLSTSTASSRDVLMHALAYLDGNNESVPEFCLLQPTSPLRQASDICAAIDLFYKQDADAVISTCTYEHPLHWMMELGENQVILNQNPFGFNPEAEQTKYVRPNGAIYIYKNTFFQNYTGYVSDKSHGYIMPPERSVDIDTPIDWELAEVLIRRRNI